MEKKMENEMETAIYILLYHKTTLPKVLGYLGSVRTFSIPKPYTLNTIVSTVRSRVVWHSLCSRSVGVLDSWVIVIRVQGLGLICSAGDEL